MLDSVQLDNRYIGTLKKDSAAVLKDFPAFEISGSWPLLRIEALDQEGNRMYNLAKCGTKATDIKEGFYRFDIRLNTAGLKPKLDLIRHY